MILSTKFSLIFFFFIVLSKFYDTNGMKINFITFQFNKNSYIDDIINEFNEYSKENNLDIELNKIFYSSDNVTSNINDYATAMESSLIKGSKKHDLIMVNAVYVYRFENYVTDLRNYVSKEIRDLYSNDLVLSIGMKNNKLIGLPLYHDIGVLYSNRKYLGKYNITVPETWDEMIEKASFILEKEKQQGNTDLIGYLGNFPESEAAIASTMEFLYSFRENKDAPLPSFRSNDARRAFIKLKEIKDKISSTEGFRINEGDIVKMMVSQKAIFGRFWNGSLGMYKITRLPGEKKGISASWVNGYYLIMNKNISDEKKKASGKVIEFLLSRETQEKHMIENMKISGSELLYDDETLCQKFDCNLYKSLHLITRVSDSVNKNNDQNVKFRNQVYNYLYGDADLDTTLKKLDYLVSIFTIKYTSFYGMGIMIATMVLVVCILGSVVLVFIDRFYFFLTMFNKRLWLAVTFGLCLSVLSNITYLGEVTTFKCKTKFIMMIAGGSLFFYPFFIKEFICFPESNRFSKYMSHHTLTILGLMSIQDIVGCIVVAASPMYAVGDVNVENGMNYNTCVITNKIYYFPIAVMFVYKAFILLFIGLLAFVEWNMEGIATDIRIISTVLYSNLLLILIQAVFRLSNSNSIYTKVAMNVIIMILFAFINYMVLIWLKMYQEIVKKRHQDSVKVIMNQNHKLSVDHQMTRRESDKDKGGLKNMLLNYHYMNSNLEVYAEEHDSNRSKENSKSAPSSHNPRSNSVSVSISNTNISPNGNPKETEVIMYSNVISFDQRTEVSNDRTLYTNYYNNGLHESGLINGTSNNLHNMEDISSSNEEEDENEHNNNENNHANNDTTNDASDDSTENSTNNNSNEDINDGNTNNNTNDNLNNEENDNKNGDDKN